MSAGDLLYPLLAAVTIIGTALGSYTIARRQNKRDYSQDLAMTIQALEVNNKMLEETNKRTREELIRVQAHRDQLLAEQAALMKKLLLNGNGKDHS